MYCRWVLPIIFLVINIFNSSNNEVEAGAHELVPFRSSWLGSIEKSPQVEETPNHINRNKEFAEFPNLRPRKLKTKDTLVKRTHEKLKKSHEASKKKKKKKRKRKKKPARNPKRFVKATSAERDRESNMSDSIEITQKSKPVDIIVHIKVNE